jgi:hypothetical protein
MHPAEGDMDEQVQAIEVGDEGGVELSGAAARALATPAESPATEHDGRRPRVRGRTISIKRLSKRELERGRQMYPDVPVDRPKTRADCLQGEHAERPCPFVSCKHHLYLDVSPRSGAIKLNFPHLEVWEMPETCALDVADRGGVTLEEVGEIMNLTRERIRQLETRGLAKLKALNEMAALVDYIE